MKRFVFAAAVLLLSAHVDAWAAPVLKSAQLVRSVVPQFGEDSEIVRRTSVYTVNCTLEGAAQGDSITVRDAGNWELVEDGAVIPITGIKWRPRHPNTVKLLADMKQRDKLSARFLKSTPASKCAVTIDSATTWSFGEGERAKLSVERLADQQAFYAVDYDLSASILKHDLATSSGGLWFRSLALTFQSNGALATDDSVRNGTETAINLRAEPFYFVQGLIYSGRLQAGYQVDTRMNSGAGRLFDVIARRFKLSAEVEVPLTNYPFVKLHAKTGYARVAMPLTVAAEYYVTADDNDDVPDRMDVVARYEMPFSAAVILQGEWRLTEFQDAPVGMDKTVHYYSVSLAQDLGVTVKALGILHSILGLEEETRGNNFIYYRIEKGRRPPAFEDRTESYFGFSAYF